MKNKDNYYKENNKKQMKTILDGQKKPASKNHAK